MIIFWYTLNKSSEHYWMIWASIDIYDVSYIDVSYMLGIGWAEQTVEKSHVGCCVKNYKKNKKIIILWHTLYKSSEHYWMSRADIHIYDGSCIVINYKLVIDRSEQTVEKSHVRCCENNYKKNKKWPIYVILQTKVPNIIECPRLVFTYMMGLV